MKIQQVLRSWIFQEHRLRQILLNISQNQTVKKYGSKERSLNAAPQPHYDVIISVLNPRPDLHNIQWNVRSASEGFLISLLFFYVVFRTKFSFDLQPMFNRFWSNLVKCRISA